MKIAIIPVYNEEKTILNVIKGVKKYCKIIVVDDGSTDKTKQIAEKEGVIVISNKINKGYGRAVQLGINKALEIGGEIIITIDGDGQHNPDDIPKFLKAFELGADVISGSRFLGTKIHCSKKRKLAIKLLTTLVYLLTDLHMSDIQSGFRAYKRSVFEKIKVEDQKMGLSVEIPIKAKKAGFKFMEIPIEVKYFYQIKSFWDCVKQGTRVAFATLKHKFSK